MSNEATVSSTTIPGNFTFNFNYAGLKVIRECTHCGFETDLYDSSAEYKCPICRQGTMCHPTQDLTWYQDSNSSWAALQQGFYGPGKIRHALDGAPSAPIYDGYLFEEVDNALDDG